MKTILELICVLMIASAFYMLGSFIIVKAPVPEVMLTSYNLWEIIRDIEK